MDPILLIGGAYKARSNIANIQECVNLYMELNPDKNKAPAPTTHYPRPGKTLLSRPPVPGAGRGLYRATNDDLYAAVGNTMYFVDSDFAHHPLGNLLTDNGIPVSWADNGQTAGNEIIAVDGSVNGYQIDMTTHAFSLLVDGTGTFVGSNVALYLETFFLFNAPGTQRWYISLSDTLTFNALDVAAKSGYADNLATIGLRSKEPWLIGTLSAEPWFLAGGADFPFEAIQSTFVTYGTVAVYSVVYADISLYWLSRNNGGQRIIVKTKGYDVEAISTRALESELQSYAVVSDCIGSTYQIEGHTFVIFNFPTVNKTWAYDLSTEQWHRLTWTDADGNQNRDRTTFYALAYDKIVGQDWETGALYQVDPNAYSDNGDPMSFQRGFPHVVDMLKQLTHWALSVYMECGTSEDPNADPPMLGLRYSDDGGKTWFEMPAISMGATGEYNVCPQFTQLGTARDRVYEIWWSADVKTAFNAAYLEAEEAET